MQFDPRNEGRRHQISWTAPGIENAFLALDRNGNSSIDNGSELFGNYTPLRSGKLALNGFIALAEYDANRDGVINAKDAVWSSLLLWVDRNHDGWSTADELQPVAHSAVTEPGTEYKAIGKQDQWGNHFRYMSKFRIRTGANEHKRTYYDVFLRMAP